MPGASALRKRTPGGLGRRVAIGVLGQSNEHGAVSTSERSAYPQAFRSLRRPTLSTPIGPAISASGGWLCKVHDDLYDAGWDPIIVNGAIGGISFVKDIAGIMGSWGASTGFNRLRAPQSAADRGYGGDIIAEGGTVWRCVAGNDRVALSIGPDLSATPGRGDGLIDSVTTQPGVRVAGVVSGSSFANYKTGATKPTFPTDQARGYVLTETPASSADAGVQWRFEGFIGAVPPNGSGTVAAWPALGTILSESYAGMGWDPLGLAHRLHEEMQRVTADRKIIYLANGQADLSWAQASYQAALTSIANFFLARGYEVMVGLTNYSPGSSGTIANWNTLAAARTAAVTALKAGSNGARVFDGADLYTLMGTTGPMASGGGFLAADNIHHNGRAAVGPALGGVQPAGTHVANAVKAVLANALSSA